MNPVLHEELYQRLLLFSGEYSSILVETLKTNRRPLHWRKYRLAAKILEMLHEKWEGDLARQVQAWADKAREDLKWYKDLLAIRLVLGFWFEWDPTQLGKGRVSPNEQELISFLLGQGLNFTSIGRLLNRDPRTIQTNQQNL